MLQLVRNWINGKREYYTGVALFKLCKGDASLYKLLSNGRNDFNKKKLEEWLVQYFHNNKNAPDARPTEIAKPATATTKELEENNRAAKDHAGTIATTGPAPVIPANDYSQTPLFLACKKEADNLYKTVMNERAVLFNSAASLLPHEDVNRPDFVEQRRKLSIGIAVGFQAASKLYDRADFVKLHGKLPFTNSETIEVNIDGIPDTVVKQGIDNLRKNINKLKKREQTAERIGLINTHTEKLNKLLARWQLLKPEN